MIRTIRRAWRYLGAFLDGKLNEMLDPGVLIDQAIDEAKRRHGLLQEQVAAVRASERELDIRIARKLEEAEHLRTSAARAVLLAERYRGAGELEQAASSERHAHTFAVRLAASESSLADLRALLERARAASAVAMRGLEQNAHALLQQVNQRARLLTELEASRLQERMNDALRQLGPGTFDSSVPTLTDVQERIDRKFASATAHGELIASQVDARMLDVERAAIDIEGDRRLDEIRAALGIGAQTGTAEQ